MDANRPTGTIILLPRFGDGAAEEDYVLAAMGFAATHKLPVLFVCLKPPYEVLMERVAQRKMDKKLPTADFDGDDPTRKIIERLNKLRPWFYEAAYANDIYDLVLDTQEHSPESVCELIDKRLAEGDGAAFQRLRELYPR